MTGKTYELTKESIGHFCTYLREQERADNTVQKYSRDVKKLFAYLDGKALTKMQMIQWKEELCATHSPASVNSMLAAVNSFLNFMGWRELMVRPLKIQKALFRDEKRELTKEEYIRLVVAAQQRGNQRMALILQTICATGIRVSELQFITVDAVKSGKTEIVNKGKRRTVFLPSKLCRLLKKYIQEQRKAKGFVFTTRTGNPVDRTNIWKEMKQLCESAKVAPEKVFPHNLRHLFGRIFYSVEKDLSRLADILGHANITTTRIYTAESGWVHARQIERLGLVIT